MLPIVRKAVKAVGGVTKLAKLIGIKHPQALHVWATRVPAEHVLPIERVTGIPRTEIRPDLYPSEEKSRKGRAA